MDILNFDKTENVVENIEPCLLPLSLLRQPRITLAPLRARSRAVSNPIPPFPPVTTTTCNYIHILAQIPKRMDINRVELI